MTDSPTPAPESGAPPTRQQLDELEALMERMLALPVHPTADDTFAALPARPSTKASEIPPPFVYRLAETPPPVEAAAAVIPAAVPLPPSAAGSVARTGRDVPREVRPTEPSPPLRTSPASPAVRSLPRPPGIWWQRPLVVVNRSFDRTTRLLGRPGVWLRGRVGRAWLGVVGILLLAAAVARVVIDLTGWSW
jgi:hypothetical protein